MRLLTRVYSIVSIPVSMQELGIHTLAVLDMCNGSQSHSQVLVHMVYSCTNYLLITQTTVNQGLIHFPMKARLEPSDV